MAKSDLITAVDQALSALKVARKAILTDAKQSASPKSTNTAKSSPAISKPARKGMSAEGRLRVAEAQRKRWAVAKRAAKKAARLAAK